jgi:outer membrane scaffolding protein for murein synthesis (MipA/OmpV family)
MINAALVDLRSALVVLCVLVPLAAQAELSNDTMIGLGLRTRPAYDGSASQHGELVPVLRYFGQPWFARSTQGVLEGGARLELAPGLHAGAQLSYESGRRSGDADFLERRGVASIGRGAALGVHGEWDASIGPVPLALLARMRRHTDSALGTQADLRLSIGVLRSGPLAAGVFTQATWANARSTAAYYGITPQQSAATGLPTFDAAGGWLSTSVGVLWSVDLGPRWMAVGNLEARRLRGDAAHSPLSERTWNHAASAGLAWRL